MKFIKSALGAVASLFGMVGAAHAAPPDFSTLTTAVDFSTVVTAIMAVAAALVVVYVAWKGAKMVISAVRGG
jgi:hypothetical protein